MKRITSPLDPGLAQLCEQLDELGRPLDLEGGWIHQQLRHCAETGVFEWFIPKAYGGQEWSQADVVRGYLKLSQACLTTTFVITQRTGACRRIAAAQNQELKERLLPGLARGELFASVGISHLTTSRRHMCEPVLKATATERGFVLSGMSPWVTGGIHCDSIVTGATLDDERQILMAVPTSLEGVEAAEPERLVGLGSSHTGAVHFNQVEVDQCWLIDGPVENVMSGGSGASTGGLETSTLALGLAGAAVGVLEKEAERREDLKFAAERMRDELNDLVEGLIGLAEGGGVFTREQLRQRANSLVLRSTQAALTAAKGTGYVSGHSVGRWCREALFFLVWSCPQPVAQAALCELAAIQTN